MTEFIQDKEFRNSLEKQSDYCKQIASTVRDTYNMIQEAIGSPLRITLNEPKDYYVCEMCGEPPMSTEDASMMDIGYCTECQEYTEFILMSEFERKDNE